MEIRRLTAADWEGLRALRLEALQTNPEAFATEYTEQVDREPAYWQSRAAGSADSFMVGLFDTGQLVGMAGLIRQTGRKTRHKAEVVSVYLIPALRGQGRARRLMEALIAEARQMEGVEQLLLTVVSENRAACGLYLALGFKTYGIEPRALRVGERYEDEELMLLFL